MIRISDDVPLCDHFRPLEEALAELRASIRPVGNSGSHQVSLARVPLVWRSVLAAFPSHYPGVPPLGEDLMPASAWDRVLQRLARDLWLALQLDARLRLAAQGPSAEDLTGAPLLASWMPAVEPPDGPLLLGRVTGHPRLGDRWITTSLLIGIDPSRTWARTWSRWYRIEHRMTREEITAACGRALRPAILAIDDEDLAQHLADLRVQVTLMLKPLERAP